MADQNLANTKSVRVKKYYKDTINELKKIIWPNKEQLINNTAAVIGLVVVIGVFIWIFDAGLRWLFLVKIFGAGFGK